MTIRKDKLVLLADALESCLDVQEELKAQLKPYEEQEEKLRAEIVKNLVGKGLDYVRCSSGLSFGLVQGRKTYNILDEQKAIKWAEELYPGLLTLKKADLAKVLKPMLQIPPIFEEKVGEAHLAVRTTESND